MSAGDGTWMPVGTVADVAKQRRVVVELADERQILIIAHEGGFHALDNICIHKQRSMQKGVVLNGRLVCPGHQWAFDLQCGWEAVKNQCQPTYNLRVVDAMVEVDTSSATTVTEAPVR